MSTHEAVKQAERTIIAAIAKTKKSGSSTVHFTQDEADQILRVITISAKYTEAAR